jgi:hypothetical protein
MSQSMKRLAARTSERESKLERELDERQRRWRYRIHEGRIWFDHEVREMHARLRQRIPAYIRTGNLLSLVTAPVIYSLIIPLAMLDAWICLYQWICFPIYGIDKVPRGKYFALDRRKLAYLNGVEKVSCTFCSYANGLIAYVREVAARTEEYWCPIRHARPVPAPHGRYHLFFDYGDGERYHRELMTLRRSMRPPQKPEPRPKSRNRGEPDTEPSDRTEH